MKFNDYDWELIYDNMNKPAYIYDGRNIMNKEKLEKIGFKYIAIGKKIIKKTILITGGAGFIGSHLCKRLLSNGHKVICLDNLFTGSEQNILEFRSNNDFKFIKHDIENTIFLDNIDEIYNLACPASPIHYQSNPIKTTKNMHNRSN